MNPLDPVLRHSIHILGLDTGSGHNLTAPRAAALLLADSLERPDSTVCQAQMEIAGGSRSTTDFHHAVVEAPYPAGQKEAANPEAAVSDFWRRI